MTAPQKLNHTGQVGAAFLCEPFHYFFVFAHIKTMNSFFLSRPLAFGWEVPGLARR